MILTRQEVRLKTCLISLLRKITKNRSLVHVLKQWRLMSKLIVTLKDQEVLSIFLLVLLLLLLSICQPVSVSVWAHVCSHCSLQHRHVNVPDYRSPASSKH